MSIKVIFLDVDGVLVSSRGICCEYSENDETLIHAEEFDNVPEGVYFPIEKACISQLRRIVSTVHGTKIVISSAWRESDEMMAFLESAIKREIGCDIIIGKTPILGSLFGGRGAEINMYLESNEAIEAFVILDDDHEDSFYANGLYDRFVKTNIDCGLDSAGADHAIRLLM